MRPGLSLRCSVVVEVRWYCNVWKPSRCNGICFSNWSNRLAGRRLPLVPERWEEAAAAAAAAVTAGEVAEAVMAAQSSRVAES